jgi:tetratricopeptide (TPR) repeat protein
VGTFAEYFAEAQNHTHADPVTCTQCADSLAEAVTLYGGDLLPTFSLDSAEFETWLVTRREALHRQALDALDRLAEAHLARGEHHRALDYARRQIALEPWRESAHRQAMAALARSGQRAAAVAQYEACRSTLEAELGIEPEPESVALYERIRRGGLAPAAGPEPPPSPSSLLPQAPITRPAAAAVISQDAPPLRDAPLHTDGAGPVAERRTTSFVLAEISGAADLLQSTGLEAWAERLHELLGLLRNEVLRYGGSLVQLHDTGLVGAFGAQLTHENDAERAVLAALGMAAIFDASPQTEDEKLAVHIGVTTGEAVVLQENTGTLTVHATALARAHDLQAQAVPGTVWVADDTYQHVEDRFEWAWLGEVLDAHHAPTYLYRPLAPVAEIPTEHDVGGLRAPLVGRDAELQTLTGAVARLLAGIGGIVTLVGEAGIGKSRLVAEARGLTEEIAPDAGAGKSALRWVAGHWLSYTEGMAYYGWQELLRRLLALPDTCTRAACSAMGERVAALCPGSAERIQPYLARLLALPVDAAAEQQLDHLVAAGLLQGAVQRAVADFLGCVAAETPLVLVLEDIHWADEASLDLLDSLLSLTDQAPLLLIAVLRPVREHRSWRLFETAVREYNHSHTGIVLPALSPEQSESLIRRLLALHGRHAAPDDDVVREVRQRGEGNPFFTAEIVRSLEGHGSEQTLPVTVQEVLMARIDRLPVAARQVLQLAAMVGRSFGYWVLADIVANADQDAAPAPRTPEPANSVLDGALLRLVRAQMIRRQINVPNSGIEVPEDPSYVFEHQLTLEAAYNSLLQRKRSVLHRRVAEALERLYPDQIETRLGLLANHWERAGDTERATAYLRRAGDQAAAQYANQEALAYYARALAMIPDTALDLRASLLFSRARIHQLRGDIQAMGQELDLLEPLVDALGSPHQHAELALAQAHRYQYSTEYEAARVSAKTAVRIASGLGDHRLEALGLLYLQLASPTGMSGHLTDYGRQAIAAARAAGARDVEGRTLREAGIALVFSGKYDEARDTLEQALAAYREVGHRAGEGNVLGGLALLEAFHDRYSSAEELAKQGIALQKEVGNRYDEGWEYHTLTMVSVFLGRYGQALKAAKAALALFADLQNAIGTAEALNDQGDLYTDFGEYGRAVGAYEQAIEVTADLDQHVGSVLMSLAGLTLVHSLNGEHDTALSYAARLLERVKQPAMFRGVARSLEAWASLVMANTAAEQGDLDAAYDHYTHVDGIFRDATEAVMIRSNMRLDAIAGLARLAAVRRHTSLALQHVAVLLEQLSAGPVDGAQEPIRIYLTCYRILAAHDDPRAPEILKAGYRVLMARAASIDDLALRRSYLENVAANRELLAAARAAGIAGG